MSRKKMRVPKKKVRRRIYCSKCGKPLSDSGCTSCGASLAEQGKEIPRYEESWTGRYHSVKIRVDKPYLERKRRAAERKKRR